MNKVAYEIVAIHVDTMYPPHYVLKENETIEQHLIDIEAFIEACGWTTEEFSQEYIDRGMKDFIPNAKGN
jgi:hypothetical protein